MPPGRPPPPWTLWTAADPGVTEALRAAGLLEDPGRALAAGTLLRDVSGRRTARLQLPGLGDVLVKHELQTSFDDRLRSFVRPPRARAERDAARHLAQSGVPVPRPLALAERARGWRGVETLYVAEWLPERRTLADVLGARGPGTAPDPDLLPRLGRILRAMHLAGYDHRDLHGGNVLVGSEAGGDVLHLIDLHRGRLGRRPSPRAVAAALERLLASLRAHDVDGAPRRRALLSGYLATTDAGTLTRFDARLAPRVARAVRRDERKHDRLGRTEGPFFVDAGALGRGLLRRGLAPADAERALVEHDRALAAHDARVLKDGRKSAVTRHGVVVVKEARATGAWARFKRLLAPWRLAWGHAHAHALEMRGLGTARSLAYLERGGRVFTLYEDLSLHPRLDHLAARLWREGARGEQVALRDASARWLADLHRTGVYHGDVKGVNVLVGGTPDRPRFHLVDTDRCRFFRGPVDAGRRRRNLAQLAASIPRVVTHSERLRWWLGYDTRLGLGDDLRTTARRVGALVAKKLRVVDAPIE